MRKLIVKAFVDSITYEELNEIILRVKIKRPPGCDDLNVELKKYALIVFRYIYLAL